GRNCRHERPRPTGDGALSLARRLHSGAAFHMSAHLEENLRALDPQLAAEIRAAAPLPLETAASGEPTLTADNVLLHSRHDPRREAARWAETQRERLAEGATLRPRARPPRPRRPGPRPGAVRRRHGRARLLHAATESARRRRAGIHALPRHRRPRRDRGREAGPRPGARAGAPRRRRPRR